MLFWRWGVLNPFPLREYNWIWCWLRHTCIIVQGHSTYSFRLYLTIQKSPIHIEKLAQLTARRLNRHREAVVSERGQLDYHSRKNKNEKTQASKQALLACVLHPWLLHHLPERHSATHLLGPKISFKVFLCMAAIQNITQEIPVAMVNRILLHHPWQKTYNLYISISNTGFELEESKRRNSAK